MSECGSKRERKEITKERRYCKKYEWEERPVLGVLEAMKQSRGAASVEYALLIVLIAAAIVVAVATLGSTMISLFKTIGDLFPTP